MIQRNKHVKLKLLTFKVSNCLRQLTPKKLGHCKEERKHSHYQLCSLGVSQFNLVIYGKYFVITYVTIYDIHYRSGTISRILSTNRYSIMDYFLSMEF
jgi:hypothetical protein